jgi:hypothetical protein
MAMDAFVIHLFVYLVHVLLFVHVLFVCLFGPCMAMDAFGELNWVIT